jgi:hypothetical protein
LVRRPIAPESDAVWCGPGQRLLLDGEIPRLIACCSKRSIVSETGSSLGLDIWGRTDFSEDGIGFGLDDSDKRIFIEVVLRPQSGERGPPM